MPNAMVLAAGLGTRLRPLTDELPKPLLPFGDRSLLEHAFALLQRAGLAGKVTPAGEAVRAGRVVVNTHHLPEAFERRRSSFTVDVALSHEISLLGTAGGIRNARPLFEPGPVVCVTSDIVLSEIPVRLLETAGGGGMVLAVRPVPRGTGSVGLGADGRIVRLRGKTFGEESAGGTYVGLMALGEDALSELPPVGCYIGDYALPLIARGGRVDTVEYSGESTVLGDDVASYFSENVRWLSRIAESGSWVSPTARLDGGVVVEGSVIGDDARVEGTGSLRSVLVLPGAPVRAPLSDCIVLPSGRVIPV